MEDLLKERYDITLGDYFSKAYSIELSDSQISEYREKGGTPWLTRKHTVFGQIVEGLDVLDEISAVKVDENDKPVSAVVINHIEITTAK
jgi:peptidyl-prolyl cis-trans isomerase B (cyclophilin B)